MFRIFRFTINFSKFVALTLTRNYFLQNANATYLCSIKFFLLFSHDLKQKGNITISIYEVPNYQKRNYDYNYNIIIFLSCKHNALC